MKRLLYLAMAVLCLSSCDDDDDKIKSNASPIYISAATGANKAASIDGALTREEIFANIADYKNEILLNNDLPDYTIDGEKASDAIGSIFDYFSYRHNNVDTVNYRLIMEAGNVIDNGQMNFIGGTFLRGRNFVLLYCQDGDAVRRSDTIGYIPNSVIREAQAQILDLWKEGNIEQIYSMFQDAFYFTPCTGEQFKAIKEDIDWDTEYDDIIAEHGETHLVKW